MKQTIKAEYFSLAGARCYVGDAISERVFRDLIKAGELPHIRLRGKILLSRADLDAWLASHRQDNAVVLSIVEDVMQGMGKHR
jgi:excisionase family DNA binding protein